MRCAIVGSGLAALASYATLRHAGLPPEEIAVFGTHADPTEVWRTRAAAIRQERMRSESDGHLAAAAFPGLALRERSLRALAETATNRYRPPVALFLAHAERVRERSGWDTSFVAHRVEHVRAVALVSTPFPEGDSAWAWMREGRPPSFPPSARDASLAGLPALSLPVGVARGYPPAVAFDYGRQKLLSRARTMWWALHDPDVREELDGVGRALRETPVFLMHARDDRTVPFGAMSRWEHLLPHAEAHAVASGGHQFLIRTGAAPLVEWLDATLRA